jgi:hypothetical protein
MKDPRIKIGQNSTKMATDTKQMHGGGYVPDKSWKSGTGNVKSGRAKTWGKKSSKY